MRLITIIFLSFLKASSQPTQYPANQPQLLAQPRSPDNPILARGEKQFYMSQNIFNSTIPETQSRTINSQNQGGNNGLVFKNVVYGKAVLKMLPRDDYSVADTISKGEVITDQSTIFYPKPGTSIQTNPVSPSPPLTPTTRPQHQQAKNTSFITYTKESKHYKIVHLTIPSSNTQIRIQRIVDKGHQYEIDENSWFKMIRNDQQLVISAQEFINGLSYFKNK